MAEVESIVEPDGITDDIGWEPVAFIDSHQPILSISASLLGSTVESHRLH